MHLEGNPMFSMQGGKEILKRGMVRMQRTARYAHTWKWTPDGTKQV